MLGFIFPGGKECPNKIIYIEAHAANSTLRSNAIVLDCFKRYTIIKYETTPIIAECKR